MKIENGVGYPDRVIGSGFFIQKNGYLITNYHVIESEVNPEYEGFSRLYIRLPENRNEKIPAKVVGWDKILDIALLKVEHEPEYVFSFSETQVLPGNPIFAIGSPGGLENTITSGIVSAVKRRLLQIGDTIQIDVPINQGNSGGPLFIEDGSLAGVVFAGIEFFEGINFAIPSKWIINILPKLYEGGKVKHPWIGTALHEDSKGLEITYIVPGTNAYIAGIKRGDRLVKINEKNVSKIWEAQSLLEQLFLGEIIELTLKRNDKEFKRYVLIEERPDSPLELASKKDSKTNLILPLFGMDIEEVSSSLFRKNYTIQKVYTGSIADETGLSQNDPFILQNFKIDEKNKIALLQIIVKKRKAGFLENAIQIGAFLEVDYFL